MSTITISNASLALDIWNFVSTEETRYYLNGFYVQPCQAGGIILVATVGHRMGVLRDPGGSVEGEPQIARLSAPFRSAIKSRRREQSTLRIEGSRATLLVGDSTVATDQDVIIDGTFPDYRRVIPGLDATKLHAGAAFDYKYIASFGALCPKGGPIQLFGMSDHDPHLVRLADRPDFFGVLMPMGGGVSPQLPHWFDGGAA